MENNEYSNIDHDLIEISDPNLKKFADEFLNKVELGNSKSAKEFLRTYKPEKLREIINSSGNLVDAVFNIFTEEFTTDTSNEKDLFDPDYFFKYLIDGLKENQLPEYYRTLIKSPSDISMILDLAAAKNANFGRTVASNLMADLNDDDGVKYLLSITTNSETFTQLLNASEMHKRLWSWL